MGILDWFRRTPQIEKRNAGGFTTEVLRMRESWIRGQSGLGELTSTVSTCVALWQNAFMIADVEGTDLLDRRTMAAIGRSLAFRGEYLGLIREDRIIPATDYDVRTRDAEPVAFRLSIPEAGGGTSMVALASEVLHIRINADTAAPWIGVSPLRCAGLSANLLHSVESALGDAFGSMPFGSMVVPMPEQPESDNTALSRSFRGQRGGVLLRESVSVSAAGGPQPSSDWRPSDLTPDLERAIPVDVLNAARDGISSAYGVLPSWTAREAQGPGIREGQRNLAAFHIQPIAELLAEEASQKLGTKVSIDVHRPLQSFDQGGSARAVATLVEAMARAKEAGLPPEALAGALQKMDWRE